MNPNNNAANSGASLSDELLGKFAKELAEQQEPLGQDFAEVLHENLWELYEVDPVSQARFVTPNVQGKGLATTNDDRGDAA